jgi:hypothetical protein
MLVRGMVYIIMIYHGVFCEIFHGDRIEISSGDHGHALGQTIHCSKWMGGSSTEMGFHNLHVMSLHPILGKGTKKNHKRIKQSG